MSDFKRSRLCRSAAEERATIIPPFEAAESSIPQLAAALGRAVLLMPFVIGAAESGRLLL